MPDGTVVGGGVGEVGVVLLPQARGSATRATMRIADRARAICADIVGPDTWPVKPGAVPLLRADGETRAIAELNVTMCCPTWR
jgi:hypothetical protein